MIENSPRTGAGLPFGAGRTLGLTSSLVDTFLPDVLAPHKRFAGLRREVWAVQAGTAVSWSVRPDAGNSVNLLRYAGVRRHRRCVAVERWDYSEPQQRFLPATINELNFAALDDVG